MMSSSITLDPAIRKLVEVKAEAEIVGVPESIISGLQNIEDLFMARDNYCNSKTTEPSQAVQEMITSTLEHPWEKVFIDGKTKWKITPRMISGNLEGFLLKFFVSASKAKRVLEIGTFTGCAALGMAEVLPDDGKLLTCEFDPYIADLSRKFLNKSPHGKKVEVLEGPATDLLKELADNGEKFDFIFVDADKDGYCDYFNLSLSLLAPGGTIAMDNALHGGRTYALDALENPPMEGVTKCNDMIASRDDVYHVLLPVRDGVMLIRRKEDMNG